MTQTTPIDSQPVPARRSVVSDDVAYILPMGIFLGFIFLQGQWPNHYALLYLLKTIATAIALIGLRKHFTKIRWNAWWLGLIVGTVGIVQWIGLQLWLQKHFAFFAPPRDAYNPLEHFHTTASLFGFIAVRTIGAAIVVPFMEELFWRDYLWRQILAPNDFKLASVGEWAWAPFLAVSAAFTVVHGNWWLTAFFWGLLVAGLLVYTKSLGACIIAHATSNLLLAIYVLRYHDWAFW
jgi:CAAX prenyl protease-like protein